MKIYHLPGSRSVRPIWLCFELAVDFELINVNDDINFRSSDEWLALSPANKVPALVDGDFNLIESGAICYYLAETYGGGTLLPALGCIERARCHQWSWFSEATLLKPMGLNSLLKQTNNNESPADQALLKTKQGLQLVDDNLRCYKFMAGSKFTLADIMTVYSLLLLKHHGLITDDYRHIHGYLEGMTSRSAFKQARDC